MYFVRNTSSGYDDENSIQQYYFINIRLGSLIGNDDIFAWQIDKDDKVLWSKKLVRAILKKSIV